MRRTEVLHGRRMMKFDLFLRKIASNFRIKITCAHAIADTPSLHGDRLLNGAPCQNAQKFESSLAKPLGFRRRSAVQQAPSRNDAQAQARF